MEKMSVLTLFPKFFVSLLLSFIYYYLLFFSLVIGINPEPHVC